MLCVKSSNPSDQENKHGNKLLSTSTRKMILGIFYHPPSPTPCSASTSIPVGLAYNLHLQLVWCTMFSLWKSEGNGPGAISG